MSQRAVRSSTNLAIGHSLRKVRVPLRTAWRVLTRHWAGAAVLALLLLAGISIRISRMAAANPAVAQAISHGARILGFSGT